MLPFCRTKKKKEIKKRKKEIASAVLIIVGEKLLMEITSETLASPVSFLCKRCHLSSCVDRRQLKALGLHQLGGVYTDSEQAS